MCAHFFKRHKGTRTFSVKNIVCRPSFPFWRQSYRLKNSETIWEGRPGKTLHSSYQSFHWVLEDSQDKKRAESGAIGKREITESREVWCRALKGSRMRVRKHLGWSAAVGTPGQKPCSPPTHQNVPWHARNAQESLRASLLAIRL